MTMIPKIIHYCWFGGSPKNENCDLAGLVHIYERVNEHFCMDAEVLQI